MSAFLSFFAFVCVRDFLWGRPQKSVTGPETEVFGFYLWPKTKRPAVCTLFSEAVSSFGEPFLHAQTTTSFLL